MLIRLRLVVAKNTFIKTIDCRACFDGKLPLFVVTCYAGITGHRPVGWRMLHIYILYAHRWSGLGVCANLQRNVFVFFCAFNCYICRTHTLRHEDAHTRDTCRITWFFLIFFIWNSIDSVVLFNSNFNEQSEDEGY